ncbi:MAG: hypothetical protein RR334_02790, partial [Clostridia bacterium]
YIPLRNDLNGFHTEFSEPNSYVLARGLFSSEGYPTAIYDENNKVGFYRDINSVPMLYDMLPVISYEPRPDMELTLGYKAMNFLTKEITGLKLSDFVPYVYYRFDVFSLFTKKVNVILEIDNGELLFDYNFASGVPMTNLYNTSDINFLIMILALALLFGVLMKAMWGFIGRIFDILMLYLAFPAIASTYPLDDGERVGNWVTAFIKKLFMAYGFVIILNVIFILSGVIFNIKFISSSDLSGAAQLIRNFGIHDYVNATYTLAGSLNFLIQTMFLLVLFSLLQGGKSKSGTSMINDLIGSEDLLAKGKALQGNTKAVYNKGMSFVSGQAIKNSASKLIGQKDETGQRRGGLVNSMPGISVIKSVADKRKFGNTMEENRIIEKELKSSFGNRNQPASKLGIIEGADKMEKSNKNVGDLSKKYSKRAEMSKSNIKAMNDEKKAKAKKKKDETDFLEKKNKVSNKNNDWKKEKKLREEYNRNLGNSNYAGVANNAMAGANDPTNANTTANEVATPSDKPSPK